MENKFIKLTRQIYRVKEHVIDATYRWVRPFVVSAPPFK